MKFTEEFKLALHDWRECRLSTLYRLRAKFVADLTGEILHSESVPAHSEQRILMIRAVAMLIDYHGKVFESDPPDVWKRSVL